MSRSRLILIVYLMSFGLAACSGPARLTTAEEMNDAEASVYASQQIDSVLRACKDTECAVKLDPGAAVDTVIVERAERVLTVSFNEALAQQAFRPDDVDHLQTMVAQAVSPAFDGWTSDLEVLGVSPDLLVPNVFAADGGMASKRWPVEQPPHALVHRPDQPWKSQAQLAGRHIAVWPSHGWYYEQRLDRWEWQRARLFQTVEDLFPLAFVVPYLAPMLESAGAYVHMPRERDVQPNEVIVDADRQWRRHRTGRILGSGNGPDEGNRYLEVSESDVAWRTASSPGFLAFDTLRTENPFAQGSHRTARTTSQATAMATWIPDLPEAGRYAVHVSWGVSEDPTDDARYTIHHRGGATDVVVNQQMMPGTWVYLGTYAFSDGQNPETGRVELSNQSETEGRTVSADAVRFGGGMGHVAREGKTSGRPRFTEGARYYMQYAGFPDTLVYNVTETANDYVDDYRSRAEWVNYLRGAPLGPNKDREAPGLDVPVDLSLAFHTDAGVTKSDATIGTLMIYSSTGMEGERDFPAGFSRFANRDLGDMMQTQIVDDVRALYDSTWTRRAIWDRDYSEAVRPNVPGVLLELLSHQNFADMRFGLDPRFRFDVSRSIYKSILRFLADQYGFDPIVQPLPPDHLEARWQERSLVLSWAPVEDPIEETARPDGYVVYVRKGAGDFDQGRIVDGTELILDGLETGKVYGFHVTAYNEGGESFPSETVAAARAGRGTPTAAIIAAFDRVSAPGTIEAGQFRGFAGFVDEGVPDGYDLSYVGDQYDFNQESAWLDDDSPGHGASWSTFETRVLTGNTFDYPMVHARALLSAGYSSITISDERFSEAEESGAWDLIDVILGEEKRTVGPGERQDFEAMPAAFRAALSRHLDAGVPLLVSGAHVATDVAGPGADEAASTFARDRLGYVWRTDRAVQRGWVRDLEGGLEGPDSFSFNTDPVGPVYRVEHPDALDPAPDAEPLLRYRDNNMSAAVGKLGQTLVMGFPFETVLDEAVQNALMHAIVHYLNPEPHE